MRILLVLALGLTACGAEEDSQTASVVAATASSSVMTDCEPHGDQGTLAVVGKTTCR